MASNPEPEIRKSSDRDLPALTAFDSAVEPRHEDVEDYLAPHHGGHERTTYVMYVGPQLVARADLVLDRAESLAYVMRLAVHPQWRRQGLARRLMDYLVREAKRQGAERLELHVAGDNAPALRLYERLGFKVKHYDVHLRLSLDK